MVRPRTVEAGRLASRVRQITFGASSMNSDEGEIKAKREAAARARRLLHEFVRADDRARVLKFVDELEAQARALEQRLSSQAPAPVTQVQMQVQQGPPANDESDKDKR